MPEEFVHRLDLAHDPNFGMSARSVQIQFDHWPSKQNGSLDNVNWHYVQTLSELVRNAVKDPVRTLSRVNELQAKDQTQYRAKVVLQSYLYLWADDCENAITVLSTHESRTDIEAALWAERIWSILDSPCAYRSLTMAATNNVTVQGWWDLAAIVVSSNSQNERATKYRHWKIQYAQHLAARFPPALFRRQYDAPRKIALLLPQSGPLSSAATAIQNGFLSAHLQTASPTNIAVDVYDTTTTEITTLIEQVVDDGVDVIVGPLEKENVRRVLEKNAANVPIVALNRPTLGPQLNPELELVQLAQVVEDDAIAVANQLHLQDLRRVLLVLGDDHWCVRAALSFRNTIDDSVIVVAETVLSDLSETTESIANLLRVTQSTSRQTDVARITRRTIEFTSRRRQDIDAIVAFVNQDEFTALSAALHYHFAGDIPVFLAEPTFRDLAQAGSYADSATFTSTPAHLYSIPITTQIQESFADSSVLYPLYVFGIDAYRTAMHIEGVLTGEPIFGYTGYLRHDNKGTLIREPIWGTVEGRTLKPRKHIISRDWINRYLL